MPRKTRFFYPRRGALLAAAAPARATRWVEGSAWLGDPYYPMAGNGGYDVRHYHLDLDYAPPPTNFLEGKALIVARATENLSRFNLDFRPFYDIHSLTVNGKRASYTRDDVHELVISPRPKIRKGSPIVVRVTYSGNARGRDRSRRLARRLGADRRRRVRRQRAAGIARLVSGQRQPARQGDLLLRGHRAGGSHRARQRQARPSAGHPKRQDDLALDRGLADGAVSRDGHERPVRHRLHGQRGRHPDLQRGRSRICRRRRSRRTGSRRRTT